MYDYIMCNCGNNFKQPVHQYNQAARSTASQQQQQQVRPKEAIQPKKTVPSLVNRNIQNSEYEMYLRYQRRYF